ncbi:MAG: DUF4215 domain-containing protein [Myxococcota bacterium]
MLLLLLACRPAPAPAASEPAPRCGDGEVADDEECDDGAANGDDPDACRANCLLPACGDGVVDGGEACDDGALVGGDGCDGLCAEEDGTLEVEPNDTPAEATPAGARVHGTLPADDVDCFSFAVPRCGAVAVTEAGACTSAMTMALYDPAGALLAVGAPGEGDCAALDPADQPGARWVAEGTWSVCVAPVAGEIASYALDVATVDSASLDADAGDDLDDDGEPDSCDLDRDGDGVDDATDTCPDVSNGPDTTLALSENGYVTTFLGAGPFTGDATTEGCRPAEDARAGEDVEGFAPAAGDAGWRVHLLTSGWFDLLEDYATVEAPREAYAMVYLRSDGARAAILAVGADDGVFAWWNGERVLDVAGCQGVTPDQFQAPVTVAEGWNTLLLKVRDQGGAWGLTARLLTEDGAAAITDLAPALDPEGVWLPDQTDTDGDGVGDACDG